MQTFVLAQQPTGYFVLNDIFRYINEEGDEEVVEPVPVEDAAGPLSSLEDVEMPKAQASTEETTPEALNAEVVDKKLETVESEQAPTPSTNGTSEEVVEAEAPVAESKEESTPEAAEKAIEEEIKEPEKPKEPVPTPVVTRTPSAAAKPVETLKPAAPAKPKSWASLVGSSTPKPAVPASVTGPKTGTPPAQARAAPPAKAAPVQAQPESTVTAAEKDKENTPGAGWQTAGDNAKRQTRPQSISQAPLEKEGTMAYIRNVTEKLGPDELRSALESFGTLIYFDINRGKVWNIF